MRSGRIVSILTAALALSGATATAAPPPLGTVTTVQLVRGRTAQAALLADVDRDGRDDLVLATSHGGQRPDRKIEVHLRRATGDVFVAAPDLVLEVPDDAVAFAVGDVHADAGAEIVLFSASGAFAWRPLGPEGARFVRLVAASFLWQLADPKQIFAWERGVVDLDGDGLPDLVLPEPDGWRIALQRRGPDGVAGFATVSAPRVPAELRDDGDLPAGARRLDARARRREVRVAITIGDEDEDARDLLAVSESSPAPQFLDWNADGRLDLLAQTSHELLVWLQRADGFPETPDASFELPVAADRARRLDVSYGAYVADLDGDRRADCVMLAGDARSDEPRTQVLAYVQAKSGSRTSPLFGDRGLPAQLLRIAGIAGSPDLADVDGDGRPDLVVGSVRLDGAVDAARAAASGTIDAELYVFANRGGTFSDRPTATVALAVKAEGLRKAKSELLASFFGDVTGDGVRELFLRDDPERLRVMLTRRAGEDLAIAGPPLWETHVAADARVLLPEPHRGAAPEILVLEGEQVLFVRFR